jgi:hypothetical protein
MGESRATRERVEAELEDCLRPSYEARDSGDQALALKAAGSILDRAYERARQATELSGPDGRRQLDRGARAQMPRE